jgi:hypothetical protein
MGISTVFKVLSTTEETKQSCYVSMNNENLLLKCVFSLGIGG